jgi:hypothetical protein
MARPRDPRSSVSERFLNPYFLAWATNSPNVGIWENRGLIQAAREATRISGVGIFTPRFLMLRPKVCCGANLRTHRVSFAEAVSVLSIHTGHRIVSG